MGSVRTGTAKPSSAAVASRAHCSNRELCGQQLQQGGPPVAQQPPLLGQGDTCAEPLSSPEVLAEFVMRGAEAGGCPVIPAPGTRNPELPSLG